MTTKQVVGIAVKLFVVYLIFSTLLAVSYSISAIAFSIDSPPGATPSNWTLIFVPVIAVATCVIALLILWKTANSLTMSQLSEEEINNNLTTDSFMKTILSCMGVYFAIQGILAFLGVYAQARNDAQFTGEEFEMNINFLIPSIAQLVFGCILIATPKQWIKMLRSIGEK